MLGMSLWLDDAVAASCAAATLKVAMMIRVARNNLRISGKIS
jgi:hypothetical protein